MIKVQRLGLGAFLESGEYITVNQLYKALGYGRGSSAYKNISWVEQRGLPVKLKTVRNNKFKIIYIDDFWQWAEANRNFIDFAKMAVGALGKEPEWVKEQRKADQRQLTSFKKTPWSPYEDERLKFV